MTGMCFGFWLVLLIIGGTPLHAARLQEKTLAAWNDYVRLTEKRIEQELGSPETFFGMRNGSAEMAPSERREILSGGIVVSSVQTHSPGGQAIEVPGGAIHHWRGTVFIPDSSIERVLGRILNPDRSIESQDDVLASEVLDQTEESLRIYLKIRRSGLVTVTYNTEHWVRVCRHNEQQASSRSIATRIAELEQAGTPAEREKPEGEDRGFLWRLNSYWRYEQTAGGVLVQCESLTLSRSVPLLLAPLAQPIISAVARESMERTLTSLRSRLSGG
jgi:hypothetical protein